MTRGYGAAPLLSGKDMSLTGFIQRPDGSPLGSEEEVMRQLSTFFPGVSFKYQAERPSGETEARGHFFADSEALATVLRTAASRVILIGEVPWPRHYCLVESPVGWFVEFKFVARPTVPWVQATSYGMTSGLDEIFERLRQATGWVTSY